MTVSLPPPLPAVERPRRVVVAGHKLHFVGGVITELERAGHVVAIDRWGGHHQHDEARSRELLDWAEVVVCEWCLGNAVWYAARKRPGQRLLVHFHRFEIDKRYPAELDIDAVDLVVFAGPHFRDRTVETLGWPRGRAVYVPNPVDIERFDRPKLDGATRTLGLLGYHRRLKRLDLALDVLERLRREDGRYRLLVKGSDPRRMWVWRHDEERRYFEEQFARCEAPPLRGAVEFEDHDERVDEWFRRVGFVLSPSDLESFHLALAEGMASGAVPVIRRRDAAAELFGERWTHDDTTDMATAVATVVADGRWEQEGETARRFVADHYRLGLVGRAWRALVLGVEPSSLVDLDDVTTGTDPA